MNLLQQFDQVAIINLPERGDRRRETIREFMRAGWSVDQENVMFFPAIRPASPEGFPSSGVRGCFLSHMHAIRQASRDGAGSILIMEDDIAFRKDADRIGLEAIEELGDKSWDIIYFGHALEAGSIPADRKMEKISEPLLLAHFYALNGRCFDRFTGFLDELLLRPAGHPDGGPMHYDGAISTFRMQNPDVDTYVVNPSIGYQRSSRTDLHPLGIRDTSPLLSPFTKGIRQAKNAFRRFLDQ